MAFSPTIVALPVDPVSAPWLGFSMTEIKLTEPGSVSVNAGIPRSIGYDSRDKITEGVTGADTKVARRKLSDIELDINFVSAEKKAQIDRLIADDRTVFFCPNMDASTRWSFPLQGSLEDFTGRVTMACTRTGDEYIWDEQDKVFKSFAANTAAFGFGGAWLRYLRAQSNQQNLATVPHPTNTGTGWSVLTGAVWLTYVTDILTPVLAYRQIAGKTGVVFADAATGVLARITFYSLNTLNVSNSVVATICLAWKGRISIYLKNTAATVTYDSFTGVGDGTFQLIRLGGNNTDGANQSRLHIEFSDTVTKRQSAIIGPVFMGSENVNVAVGKKPKLIDWSDGVTTGNDVVANTNAVKHLLTDATFSWFGQFTRRDNTPWMIGSATWKVYCAIRASNDEFFVAFSGGFPVISFPAIAAEFGMIEGNWYHFALALGNSGAHLYVNGVAHSTGGATWNTKDYGSALHIGYNTEAALDAGGISHLRCDGREWSAEEVADHYDTYFDGAGRGVVEPLFGRELLIESVDWTPLAVSTGAQWRGAMVLRELGLHRNIAGLRRQEGGV